jgi:hypothetical protein
VLQGDINIIGFQPEMGTPQLPLVDPLRPPGIEAKTSMLKSKAA